jgi:hypothetical protein
MRPTFKFRGDVIIAKTIPGRQEKVERQHSVVEYRCGRKLIKKPDGTASSIISKGP